MIVGPEVSARRVIDRASTSPLPGATAAANARRGSAADGRLARPQTRPKRRLRSRGTGGTIRGTETGPTPLGVPRGTILHRADAVRTRANDYHREGPRADRRFTTDFYTFPSRHCKEAETSLLRRGTAADQPLLPSENVVWRAQPRACPAWRPLPFPHIFPPRIIRSFSPRVQRTNRCQFLPSIRFVKYPFQWDYLVNE